MLSERPVIVLNVPDFLVVGSAQLFFEEIKGFLRAERPRIVFDFSAVRNLDSAGVKILLECMEEVMKRNGDLKLAAISKRPATILEVTKVDSLFEIFDQTSEAVQSFHEFVVPTFQAAEALSEISAPESGAI
jgi:anti-anti-sigma factor